ncbi:MAG: hypothetical protein A2V63_00305 [Candidatus Eisenbacteria bacterium RBG_19FT_COMBO_70_11]|nr:MAG: hypothetical protein A2V63_00305 [Candidatus Eisenbacteria bacterium RBG_19FT_COMBO_70_11]
MVHANVSSSTSIYDPVAGTMTAGPATSGAVGKGAHGFKRPDGTFLIVHGAGSSASSLYDPVANTMSAGPTLTALVDLGGHALRRPDGKVLVVCGKALKSTSLYDPPANSFSAGPDLTGNAQDGAHAIPRPNGTFLIVHGNASTGTSLYDPVAGTMSAGPSVSFSVDKGGHCLERPDDNYLVVCGNKDVKTSLYDPVADTFSAGPSISALAENGACSLQRADGTFLIFSGKATTNTTLYDPVANTMTAGPAPANGVGVGAHALQRPDGLYLIVNGALTTTTTLYDAGWIASGSYVSEKLNPANIDSWNALSWARDLDDTLTARVRTASSSAGLDGATWRGIANGGSINPGAGERWLQIGLDYSRAIPKSTGALEDVWSPCRAPFRVFPRPLAMSVTANYTPVFSVAASKASFAYGTRLLNTWLPADSSTLTNDGTSTETLVAQISTFTAGANTWSLSAASNGADQIRAQWFTTSASGPWTDIAAYDQNFTVRTGLAATGTVKLYFRIQTPTSTSSYAQYASTLTVTAQ